MAKITLNGQVFTGTPVAASRLDKLIGFTEVSCPAVIEITFGDLPGYRLEVPYGASSQEIRDTIARMLLELMSIEKDID